MIKASAFVLTLCLTCMPAFAQELETLPGVDDVIVPPVQPDDWQGQVNLNATPDPDVLVLYTDQTIAAAGGDEAALLAVLQSTDNFRKEAYVRSSMTIQPGITYFVHWIGHVELPDMVDELVATQASPEAHALRDLYGADIVAQITGAPISQFCGVGYLLNSFAPGSEAFSYSVSHYLCLPSTYAHEIGHNQGCMHDPDNSGRFGITNYAFGHRICDGTHPFRTIMSYSCPGVNVARIDNYSNPDVMFQSQPTGTTATDCTVFGACRDCARAIDETATFVAGFRERIAVTTTLPPPTTTTTSSTTSSTTSTSVTTTTSTTSTTSTTVKGVCGNGRKDPGEQCDSGVSGKCKFGCETDCTCIGGKPGWGKGRRR